MKTARTDGPYLSSSVSFNTSVVFFTNANFMPFLASAGTSGMSFLFLKPTGFLADSGLGASFTESNQQRRLSTTITKVLAMGPR